MAETRAQYVARKRRENEDYRSQVEAAEARQSGGSWLDRTDGGRRLAGEAGALTGLALGVPVGAFHTISDGLKAGYFVDRLFDPYDAARSPPGRAAWDDVVRASGDALSYLRDPGRIIGDLGRLGVGGDVRLEARPAPLAATAADEFRRQRGLGLNVGEGVFDAAALIGGAAELRSIPELRALSKGAAATDYLPAGVSQALADYMATPYAGMGSHAPVPRSTRLPWGSPLPKSILDSPFNLKLPPDGTPRGAFYRYHYAVDPSYHGGPVKRAFGGGGWSGRELGWTKYGPAARLWYGAPGLTKAAGYLGLAGLGWPVAQFCPAGGAQ